MNEVFETLSDVFEGLRSKSGDREYSVQTGAVDHAYYKAEQRAYYQGIVDAIQILEGLGMIPRTAKVKKLLEKISG